MRNPERISPIMKELTEIWQKNPDYRFFQLIAALTKGNDLFYVEDDKTLEYLRSINQDLT